MVLYKYLAPSRTDVLGNCLIRFTQPAAFNDLFDLRPNYAAPASDQFSDDETEERVARFVVEKIGEGLSSFMSGILNKTFGILGSSGESVGVLQH